MPKVSIIMPVYQSGPYLRTCLDSVLAQSFSDFELILIDDGSTDDSAEILDEYAAKDERITVVHKENGGPSTARNLGLDMATAPYVYLPDSDDILEPDLLEKVLPEMEKGYDVVAFAYQPLEENESYRKPPQITEQPREIILNTPEERYAFLAGPFRRKAIRWEFWDRIYRRDLIERWNIRCYDSYRIYTDDMYFAFCHTAHASRILWMPQILYTYRIHENSFSKVFRDTLMISTSHIMTEGIREHFEACDDCGYFTEHFGPLYYLLHKAAVRRLRRYQEANGLTMAEALAVLEEHIPDIQTFMRIMRENYNDPVVIRSYREDSDPVLQETDRRYMAELLDIPYTEIKRNS